MGKEPSKITRRETAEDGSAEEVEYTETRRVKLTDEDRRFELVAASLSRDLAEAVPSLELLKMAARNVARILEPQAAAAPAGAKR